MNNKYTIKAFAKINISLDVISKREDNYHNLKMIMHSVTDLYDTLTITPFDSDENPAINITSENSVIPLNENNTIFRAYNEFYKYADIKKPSFLISVDKKIPVFAGLGGGSSDAAAFLNFLNEYHNNIFTKEKLCEIGNKVGADVPFCIMGNTYLAEGTGEILTLVPPLPSCYIVIAKPKDKGLSTKHIFSKVNISKINLHPDTDGIIEALKNNDLNGVCKRMYNVLEEYSINECDEILKLKNIFYEFHALGSIMSGSGNSVFGIFDNYSDAKKSYDYLKNTSALVFLNHNV